MMISGSHCILGPTLRGAQFQRSCGNAISVPSKRNKAMQAVVGLCKNRREIGDFTAHVRNLRRGKRLNCIGKQ